MILYYWTCIAYSVTIVGSTAYYVQDVVGAMIK